MDRRTEAFTLEAAAVAHEIDCELAIADVVRSACWSGPAGLAVVFSNSPSEGKSVF